MEILDKKSPFAKLIDIEHCGLLDYSEENCPIAKNGFSNNPEKRGIALNNYISLFKKTV